MHRRHGCNTHCLFLGLFLSKLLLWTNIAYCSATSSSSSSSTQSPNDATKASFHPQHHALVEMRNRGDDHSSSSAPTLGQIFTNREAAVAFQKQKLNSKFNIMNNRRIRLVFLNQTDEPLVLCWVHENGNLHHYYTLKPCVTVLSSLDRKGVEMKNMNSHLENTFLGHAFVIGTCARKKDRPRDGNGSGNGNDDSEKDKGNDENNTDDNRIGDIVAGYRPLRVSLSDVEDSGLCVHVIKITKHTRSGTRMLRKRKGLSEYQVQVEQYEIDSTPLDTSNKVYHEMTIGGWRCMCEDGVFQLHKDDKDVKKQLELDLQACALKLPPKACELLQKSVPIWINQSQKYGPKCAPVQGKGMCFHVHPSWLCRNGMSAEKCGGVEIYEVANYLESRGLWHGTGGSLLHELSHAWHNKFVPDGYSNKDILACYEAAMEEKLYDCVQVHNRRGGIDECRAYAATNAEEYFAELSVAFLGGVGEDESLEFNKWFPFNRKQLKEHDPRAYEMLFKVWGLEEHSD